MPICRELIGRYGRQALSKWVMIFRSDLHPWGGEYCFVVGQENWQQGPVRLPTDSISCVNCDPSEDEGTPSGEYKVIVEDSEYVLLTYY